MLTTRRIGLSSLMLALLLAASPVAAQDLALAPPSAPVADLGTHPDEGLMIAGGSLFLLSVTLGAVALMPAELGSCVNPGEDSDLPPDHGFASCAQAPMAAIPFAHILGGGFGSIVGGSLLLVAEVIGLFIFIGGAAHHHPNEAAAPQPGDVSFWSPRDADAGLGLTLHL